MSYRMNSHGQQYCKLAFKLLSSLKDLSKKKELENQVNFYCLVFYTPTNQYYFFKKKDV